MSALDFIVLVLDHLTLVFLLSVGFTSALYIATRNIAGNIVDPFHFFYSFTFGTGYAVVCLLAVTGHVGLTGVSVVGGYGLLFLVTYRLFSRVTLWNGLQSNKQISMGGGWLFAIACLLYLAIATAFLQAVGFAAFLRSRYQIGQYNLLALIMDPLRLFIAGYIAILILNCHGQNRKLKRALLLCAELSFVVLSSLINGSKSSFLESAYAAAVAIIVSRRAAAIPWKKLVKPLSAVLIVAIAYAVSQQYFNLQASGAPGNSPADALYTRGPLLLDQFGMRIVNNGDIYYYVLPAPVFENIVIDHPFILLFGDVFGGKLMGALFGVDLTKSVDIGHQAMGYWYGEYNGDVGPTDHFDLEAYKFFGPFGGIIFVLCVAFTMARVNALKKGRYDNAGCAVVAAVYIRSLIILISPHVGLAFLEESVILFTVLAILAKALGYAASRPRQLISPELKNSAC
jgi:hypothetical protein